MIHRRDPFLKEISTQVNTILHEELYKIELFFINVFVLLILMLHT